MTPQRAIGLGRNCPCDKKAFDAAIYTTSGNMMLHEQATWQKAVERMDDISTCALLGPSAFHARKSTAEQPSHATCLIDHCPFPRELLEAFRYYDYLS